MYEIITSDIDISTASHVLREIMFIGTQWQADTPKKPHHVLTAKYIKAWEVCAIKKLERRDFFF